ncbi:MAG: type secretion protein IcmC [Gammaproteobacteria bacterium]|jgi:intracellular multiplication protein IcmC|nr:type secretion protein IcmC [Gammaproteobacteria bacterium]
MLKNRLSKIAKNSKRVVWSLLALAPIAAQAASTAGGLSLPFGATTVPDVVTMLLNLDKSFPPLMYMVSGFAYLFGFSIVIKAIWELKKYTMGVSMVAQNDLRPSITHLLIGAALIFLPSTLQTLLATVYGTDAITGYTHLPDTSWQVAQDTLIIFVQFVGLVAVVRGLLHLHKAANGQSQQNGFAKGIIHLVGGVLALNIIQAKDILYSTLGLTT